MSTVQSMGLGSGIDVQLIVDKLVEAERGPKQEAINTKTSANQSKVSALGELTSSLSSLKDIATKISSADNLVSYQNNASSLTGISITSDSQARSGDFTLNVSQLAESHKAVLKTVTSGSTFTSGDLTFAINGQNHTISWNDDETLSGIRYLINQQSASTGVQATIVTGTSGENLILNSTTTGANSQFSVTSSGGGLSLFDHQMSTSALGTTLGNGTLTFTVAGVDYDFAIDSNNNSRANFLTNIQSFLQSNSLDDDLQVSLSADNQSFIFTSSSTFSVSSTNEVFTSSTTSSSQQMLTNAASQIAQDLSMTIDGLSVSSSSNTITGALEGIILNVSEASGSNQVLSISSDLNAVATNIKGFVTQLNATSNLIDSYLVNTREQKAAFASDNTIKSVVQRLRDMMSSSVSNNSIGTNYQLGIDFDYETRSYKVDDTRLLEAINGNYDDLVTFFSDTNEGIATQFSSYLDDILDRTGLLKNLGASLNESLSRILDEQLRLEQHVSDYQARLVKQYTAMDTAVAQFQSTGNYITQWVDAMNNNNKN